MAASQTLNRRPHFETACYFVIVREQSPIIECYDETKVRVQRNIKINTEREAHFYRLKRKWSIKYRNQCSLSNAHRERGAYRMATQACQMRRVMANSSKEVEPGRGIPRKLTTQTTDKLSLTEEFQCRSWRFYLLWFNDTLHTLSRNRNSSFGHKISCLTV